MCNIIINNDNDVTHRKIFTLSKLLVIFYTLKYGEFITYASNKFRKMHTLVAGAEFSCGY